MKLLYLLISIIIVIIISGCGSPVNNEEKLFTEEQNRITDSTIIIDISKIDEKEEEFLSSIIESVRYVKLDTSVNSYLGSIIKMEVIDSLIYIYWILLRINLLYMTIVGTT